MNVDIKLTHGQHQMLLSKLGSEKAIHNWVESCIDHELHRHTVERA